MSLNEIDWREILKRIGRIYASLGDIFKKIGVFYKNIFKIFSAFYRFKIIFYFQTLSPLFKPIRRKKKEELKHFGSIFNIAFKNIIQKMFYSRVLKEFFSTISDFNPSKIYVKNISSILFKSSHIEKMFSEKVFERTSFFNRIENEIKTLNVVNNVLRNIVSKRTDFYKILEKGGIFPSIPLRPEKIAETTLLEKKMGRMGEKVLETSIVRQNILMLEKIYKTILEKSYSNILEKTFVLKREFSRDMTRYIEEANNILLSQALEKYIGLTSISEKMFRENIYRGLERYVELSNIYRENIFQREVFRNLVTGINERILRYTNILSQNVLRNNVIRDRIIESYKIFASSLRTRERELRYTFIPPPVSLTRLLVTSIASGSKSSPPPKVEHRFYNTFNISIQLSSTEDEESLRELGRKIARILAEEARRYGVEI